MSTENGDSLICGGLVIACGLLVERPEYGVVPAATLPCGDGASAKADEKRDKLNWGWLVLVEVDVLGSSGMEGSPWPIRSGPDQPERRNHPAVPLEQVVGNPYDKAVGLVQATNREPGGTANLGSGIHGREGRIGGGKRQVINHLTCIVLVNGRHVCRWHLRPSRMICAGSVMLPGAMDQARGPEAFTGSGRLIAVLFNAHPRRGPCRP